MSSENIRNWQNLFFGQKKHGPSGTHAGVLLATARAKLDGISSETALLFFLFGFQLFFFQEIGRLFHRGTETAAKTLFPKLQGLLPSPPRLLPYLTSDADRFFQFRKTPFGRRFAVFGHDRPPFALGLEQLGARGDDVLYIFFESFLHIFFGF